eukprot:4018047-Amphidinium_carterae.1
MAPAWPRRKAKNHEKQPSTCLVQMQLAGAPDVEPCVSVAQASAKNGRHPKSTDVNDVILPTMDRN